MSGKRPLKKKLMAVIAPRLLKWLLLLIGLSCRKRWVGLEHIETLKKKQGNWIYSLWHNNISMAALMLRNQNLLSMISTSEDGSLAATVIELFGNQPIRGSSSRGSTRVLLGMIKGVKKGQVGAITPDGPKGPRYQLQSGAISISQHAKVPLVPIHFESTRQWIFDKSWDKHKLPKPFSTIVISIGKPYYVADSKPANNNHLDDSVQEFQARMMHNVEHAETIVNSIRT